MEINDRTRQPQVSVRFISTRKRTFKAKLSNLVVILLILTMMVTSPAKRVSGAPDVQASTLTFITEADARVQEANPNNNYGTASYLQVDSGSNSDVESFIRFTVNGVTGSVQSALLRVYVTTNSSANGPAVYAANNSWNETDITWNNRPARTSSALDNKGATSRNSWVEYSVTAAVNGNGVYTFVLAADSSDAIRFSAREGSRDPELVVTFSSSADTATPTQTATVSQPPTATNTPSMTEPPAATATSSRTSTPSGTATSDTGTPVTFITDADARVSEASPATNYGSSTTLQADGNSGGRQASFIRFTLNGISGAIQSVRLRVFCTTNGTSNGPAVYLANSSWTESGTGGVTWNNQPALASSAADNAAAFGTNSWVEYDVTALVTGNGTYTFALVADSTDGVVFSSRQGATPPQLVVTPGTGSPAATHTPSQPPSNTTTPTMTQPPAATPTRTPTASAAPTGSPAPGNQVLTFNPVADSYVDASNSSANHGSETQLRGDGSPVVRSYLHFNIQGLNGTATRATLRIFANSASSTGYEIHSVSSSAWEETTITYSNAPAVGSVLDTSGGFNAGDWTTVDVTAHISGNGSYSLALTVPGSTAISFASREVGNNAPQLTVEIQGGPAATATATRTATVVNTGTATSTATQTAAPASTATVTPSPTSTRTPTATSVSSESAVLVGAGDITNCSRTQDEQTAQLLDTISGTVFTAGDNAYTSGTYTEYLNCYEPSWGRHKSRTKPSPGNHEYNTSGAAGYFQYFNNIPSYYAYDLGAWRIYSLNSEISASATSAQATWLQNDLAANPSQCVLAYWHRPRWSSGANHGDNTSMQTIWGILYNAGAELVLNGHEHHYERFAEMDASGAAVSQGLREIVAGTGGASLYPFGTPVTASQVRNNSAYGVLKVTLHPSGYDWEFVAIPGSTFSDSGSSNCH